jgi:hypothetical protein
VGMKYKAHRIDVKSANMQQELERFINGIDGEIVSIIPNVKPTFLWMGGTARIDFLLVVEKVSKGSRNTIEKDN